MINHTYKDLYNQDSIKKNITATYDGGQITNSDLYLESVEIKESICSESQLIFGCCEASELSMKIANISNSLKGKWLELKETLNGQSTTFRFGKYKVYSDVPSADRNYRNIVAYDLMYDVINSDVAEWYNGLAFPLTQKNFRDSFFNYLGITQESVSLIHDSMEIEKTIDTTSISGKDIITSLCELNGVFGHINRDDNFEYISLNGKSTAISVSKSLVKSGEYEDFVTNPITKLQIRQEENDIGVVYGDGDNCYIIQNNIFVYGKTKEELDSICSKLYNKISGITYRPYRGVIRGNPCYMVGDSIKLNTRNMEIQSFIFERTLTGIQNLMDTIEANGVLQYKEDVNSIEKEIIQLKGKTNVLIRDINETRSEIKNVEEGLRTEIQQSASGIRTEVENVENNLRTEIDQSADKIKAEVQASLKVGAVNLLRNSRTLYFEDYYFDTGAIVILDYFAPGTAVRGENFDCYVEAKSINGEELSYQWYYSNKTYNSYGSFTKATSATSAIWNHGLASSSTVKSQKVYCLITDKSGNQFKTGEKEIIIT